MRRRLESATMRRMDGWYSSSLESRSLCAALLAEVSTSTLIYVAPLKKQLDPFATYLGIEITPIKMSIHLQAIITKWRKLSRELKAESYALYLAYRHPGTPWFAKVFAGLVVAYAFSPIDLVPDFIPVLGYLDDLILVPLGIAIAVRLIPAEILELCRQQARQEMSGEKPVNRLAAVMIVLIWVGLAGLGIFWLMRLLR